MSKPIIVVFAATGKSGGGMIDYILKDGSFAARAVTRNPDGDSAKALKSKGVEVVKADLDDKESLVKAMEGAYGVFGVTDFWQAMHKEEDQGKSLVDAAKQTGIKHFIWLNLDHSEWKCPHFESKANVDDYLKASGVPRTSIYTSCFIENLSSPFFAFKRDESGKVTWPIILKTDGKVPWIVAADIGGWALAAFKDPEQWTDKDIKVATEWLTPREIGKIVEEELGEPVQVPEIDEQGWKAMRNPQTEEIWLNMQIFYDGSEDPSYRDVELTKRLLPSAKTTRQAVKEWGKGLVVSA